MPSGRHVEIRRAKIDQSHNQCRDKQAGPSVCHDPAQIIEPPKNVSTTSPVFIWKEEGSVMVSAAYLSSAVREQGLSRHDRYFLPAVEYLAEHSASTSIMHKAPMLHPILDKRKAPISFDSEFFR